jgi:hypothetical protein
MSRYNPLPQTPIAKHTFDEEDLLDSLHNIPSNFDLALNGGTNRTYRSPSLAKTPDSSLLDPEAFRRLSISTISSMGRPRSASPYPYPTGPRARTWKEVFRNFWTQNQGLFLVTLSQVFGASMNVAARLLELEGEGMRPLQLLFVRQGLTAILCTVWMWWAHVPDFPLGAKSLRKLLVVRSFSGFFGIYGMYCKLRLSLKIMVKDLTRSRLTSISPRCRCSSIDLPCTLRCKLWLLPFPPRAIPTISSIRISHLPNRSRPHRSSHLVLLFPLRLHHLSPLKHNHHHRSNLRGLFPHP